MSARNSVSRKRFSSDVAVISYIAGIKLVLQLAAINGYGYFRDEFYYIACSQNPAFGYVDHPPLAMLLLRIIRTVLGESIISLRIVPALCGFLFVFLTGLIARELGGKKFAVLLASAAALAPVGNFFMHFYYSMNALDHLFWLGCVYVLIKIVKTGNDRLWILFGLLAGLGLQNKISILFLGFGLVDRDAYKYRLFGWMFLSIFILFMLQHAKDYYLSGVYPIVFAAGGVQFERWLSRMRWGGIKTVLVVLVLMFAILLAPMALPILPIDMYVDYANKVGVSGVQGENHEFGVLPQHYADMFGWEEIVSEAGRVFNTLSPEEKKACPMRTTIPFSSAGG